MLGRTVGFGQVYLESQKDAAGTWLDGGKTYRLRVPPDAPVAQFWSFSVYDNKSRCLIDTGSYPDRSSRDDIVKNADGSIDLYFGPKPPVADREKNWIKTLPAKGWFTYFRLYGPTQPFFDRKKARRTHCLARTISVVLKPLRYAESLPCGIIHPSRTATVTALPASGGGPACSTFSSGAS